MLKEPKMMDERDQEQFKIAEEADRVSNVDQTETHIAADLFEDVLCNHFDPNATAIPYNHLFLNLG